MRRPVLPHRNRAAWPAQLFCWRTFAPPAHSPGSCASVLSYLIKERSLMFAICLTHTHTHTHPHTHTHTHTHTAHTNLSCCGRQCNLDAIRKHGPADQEGRFGLEVEVDAERANVRHASHVVGCCWEEMGERKRRRKRRRMRMRMRKKKRKRKKNDKWSPNCASSSSFFSFSFLFSEKRNSLGTWRSKKSMYCKNVSCTLS